MELAQRAAHREPIWRETPFWLTVLFVSVAYGARLGTLSIRGEESRRALVAREMIETNDWIVPRTQGVPLYSRPPLQNWLIAGLALARGQIDLWCVRLPSVLAVLATVVNIYAYGRRFLQPLGAASAGLAFASTAQVIELGRMGETDALFTFLVSGSLLSWHAAAATGRHPWRGWCGSYLLAALATLTKGPQAPVYLAGAAAVYLLCTCRWRCAFTLPHAAGIFLFTAVLGCWQIPYLAREGVSGVMKIFTGDVGHRFLDTGWGQFLEHLLVYPWELAVCLLPWSVLLIVYRHRAFRAALGEARDSARFLVISMAVAFPSVWLPPGSRPRYFMSLFPCAALLAGLVVQRLADAPPGATWRPLWRLFARGSACAMCALAIAVLAISVFRVNTWFAQSPWFAALYAAVCGALAAVLWQSAREERPRLRGVLAIATFVAITHVGVMVNAHEGTTVDIAKATAEAKARLPQGARLVSFNMAHHLFVFHYAEPIPVLPWPAHANELARNVSYFCVDARELQSKALPFRWQAVAEVPCTRHREQEHQLRVIIGRVERADTAEAAEANKRL